MELTKIQNIIRDLVAAYDTGLLTKEHALYEATCVYSEMLKPASKEANQDLLTAITQAAYIALLEAIITHYVEGQILTYKIKSY
mgnify:FL=1